MRFPASGFLAVILGLLAVLHVYWAFGGRWGLEAAVPRVGGKAVFEPGRAACLGVAFLLAIGLGVSVSAAFDPWYRTSTLRLMALVFALRAVGDFRYVGFFKSVRDSRFAYWDTRLHSPLCALLAALATIASVAP
ncbi:MAG: DUF3995 domain-containing protein [Myxococcaceae bacterium]